MGVIKKLLEKDYFKTKIVFYLNQIFKQFFAFL